MELILPILTVIFISMITQRIEQARRQSTSRAPKTATVPQTVNRKRESDSTKKNVAKPNAKVVREKMSPVKEVEKPDYIKPTNLRKSKPATSSKVEITKKSVLNGIIMAEILSPPKCKRK